MLGLGKTPGLEKIIRPYRNGRDLTARPRGVNVIDLDGYRRMKCGLWVDVLAKSSSAKRRNTRADRR
jgi:hypothetical protein